MPKIRRRVGKKNSSRMKKSILIVLAIMLSCMCTSNAQNTNANTKDTTKTEKKDEGPKIYRRSSVYTLVGYLRIFPYELGAFNYSPTDIINRVNANEQYGYNTWRIPTNAEITIIKANGYADQKEKYMTQESKSGRVLLVTDKGKADILRQRNAERQKREAAIEAQRRQQREEEEKRKQEELLQQKVDSLSQLIGFIDLGLPSGTLWSAQYEPCKYSFNLAMMLYGDAIPSKKQCEELEKQCTWTAVKNKEGKTQGFIVTGKNGNSIYINRDFWSSTIDEGNSECAWHAVFVPDWSSIYIKGRIYRFYDSNVRLIKDQEANNSHFNGQGFVSKSSTYNCELEFIDLGLPSGTKWANKDYSGGYECRHYTYTENVEGIPTKEQWKELRKECEWIWSEGMGYKVIGPNKNYIFLSVEMDSWSWGYAWREYKDTYELKLKSPNGLKFIKKKRYHAFRARVQLRKIQQ